MAVSIKGKKKKTEKSRKYCKKKNPKLSRLKLSNKKLNKKSIKYIQPYAIAVEQTLSKEHASNVPYVKTTISVRNVNKLRDTGML